MDKIKKIHTLETDKPEEMILLVTGVTDKGFTKTGNPFVSVKLLDGVKTINVNFFDETIKSLEDKGVTVDSILKIQLTRTPNGFYNLGSWKLNDDTSVSKDDFVHKAPIDADKSFAWIIEQIKSVEKKSDESDTCKSIAHLTGKLLTENAEAFKRSSAAVFMHHNFLSGLLYHTLRMVDMANKICDVYDFLDRELMVCATALHDIGKISCYETMDVGEANVTIDGRLFDHALVGILMIHDAAKEDVYDPEKIKMLEHMIASHHGKKEWDAITVPAFPEAEMLHIIDLADSRMNMFEEAYKGQQSGTVSTDKVFGLENSCIYKPLFYEDDKNDEDYDGPLDVVVLDVEY